MAKSLAVINKEIADSLKIQNLSQPPEAYELTRLSEDIEKILKKPHNFLQSGPLLNDYYTKLIKFMTLMRNLNQGSYSQNRQPVIKSPETIKTDSENLIDMADFESPIDSSNIDSNLIDFVSQAQYPSTSQLPTTPVTSRGHVKIRPSSGDSLKSPIKRTLLSVIANQDRNFKMNPDDKTMIIKGKVFTNHDFNNMFIKIRNPEKNKKIILDEGQQELLDVITSAVQESIHPEKAKILKKLPGLSRVIAGQPSKAVTRKSKAITKSTLKSPNSPRTSKTASKGRNLKFSTAGSGIKRGPSKLPSEKIGKIHFNRWSKYLK